MRAFLSELRRRNVYKVGVAYAVVGWILIEVAEVLIPASGAPEWVFKVFILLVGLGFPLALVFAWAFELTPEGLKRTHEVPLEHSITRTTGRKLDFAIIALLAIALTVSVSLNLRQTPESRGPSIAVLPFTSRSVDPQHAMFVDGIHDELLTTLAKIGSLKVISRTSVMEYRDRTKNLRQIGAELGVATVLEGAVQRAGDAVRINVQLIDAATDDHLWANSYDRRLSTENVFAIQSEIATTIAEKLKATLTPAEKQRLARIPTENLQAYELYLAGRQHLYQRKLESLRRAQELFEQSLELDPGFAQAYAGLSDALNILYFNHGAISADEAFARSAALLDKALSLDNEDADIHASLGLLSTNKWIITRNQADAAQAAQAFERAIALNPNHAQAIAWYGLHAADRGDHLKAIELYERSTELDPLARVTRLNLAGSYASIGENQKALEQGLETARLFPDWPQVRSNIGEHLAMLGRLDEGLAWVQEARKMSTDPGEGLGATLLAIYMEFDQPERVVAVMRQIPRGYAFWVLARATEREVQGDLAGGLAMLEGALAQMDHAPSPFLFVAAELAMLTGQFEAARGHLERLCPSFTEPQPPIDAGVCSNGVGYGYVLQRLGEAERAERVLEAQLEFVAEQPRLGASGYGIADVQALALLGRHEEALTRLREAIDAGWRSSWMRNGWKLEADPYLAELRDAPEFRAMVAEVEADIARMRERAAQAEASGDWQPLLALAEQEVRTRGKTPGF